MDLRIEGRVAVVSGGSEGQGLATARALLAEGCKVMIAARTLATLEEARDDLEALAPGRVAAAAADMTDADQVLGVALKARERFGPVDIAVSNVIGHVIKADEAGPRAGHFADTPPAEYAAEFKQLMLSAWWLARAVIPDMKARRWGRILNIGSGVAREPQWEIPHILPNTVRPAVAAMHRSLSVELAPFGITVNNMMSGSIATQRNVNYFTWLAKERGEAFEDTVAAFHQRLPLRRPGRPEDMGNAIAFLCSEQARAISGQSFAVVGGSMRHLY